MNENLSNLYFYRFHVFPIIKPLSLICVTPMKMQGIASYSMKKDLLPQTFPVGRLSKFNTGAHLIKNNFKLYAFPIFLLGDF